MLWKSIMIVYPLPLILALCHLTCLVPIIVPLTLYLRDASIMDDWNPLLKKMVEQNLKLTLVHLDLKIPWYQEWRETWKRTTNKLTKETDSSQIYSKSTPQCKLENNLFSSICALKRNILALERCDMQNLKSFLVGARLSKWYKCWFATFLMPSPSGLALEYWSMIILRA